MLHLIRIIYKNVKEAEHGIQKSLINGDPVIAMRLLRMSSNTPNLILENRPLKLVPEQVKQQSQFWKQAAIT